MQVDMKKIKQALKDKKITYPMLAKMTGVPLPTITNFFTGKTKHPRIDTVQAILSAVGLEEEKPTLAQQIVDTTLANLNIDDFNNLTPAEQQAECITVGELFSRFVETSKGRMSAATLYDYSKKYKLYIADPFGTQPVSSLTRRALSDWQDGLSYNLTAHYRNSIRNVFSCLISYAVEKELLTANPFTSIRQISEKNAKIQHDFWTLDEYRQFDAVVDSPLWSAFFMFLYVSGCRKGEAFALTWADIDFDSQTATISKSYSVHQKRASAYLGVPQKIGTKNKKSASIYLPTECVKRLLKIKPSNALQTDFVFSYKTGQPLAEMTVRRALDDYTAKAGVKRIRVHDFRHSCASLIISQTDSELTALYSIAERLRDTPEQILKTYGHLFPSQSKSVNEKLDSIF